MRERGIPRFEQFHREAGVKRGRGTSVALRRRDAPTACAGRRNREPGERPDRERAERVDPEEVRFRLRRCGHEARADGWRRVAPRQRAQRTRLRRRRPGPCGRPVLGASVAGDESPGRALRQRWERALARRASPRLPPGGSRPPRLQHGELYEGRTGEIQRVMTNRAGFHKGLMVAAGYRRGRIREARSGPTGGLAAYALRPLHGKSAC